MALRLKGGVPRCKQFDCGECWFAAVCMISKYHGSGLSHVKGMHTNLCCTRYKDSGADVVSIADRGLNLTFADSFNGLDPLKMANVAEWCGFEMVSYDLYKDGLSVSKLGMMLQLFGPLWCGGMFGGGSTSLQKAFTVAHAIVLVGTDGDEILYNDPEPGTERRLKIKRFNELFFSAVEGSLLYQKPTGLIELDTQPSKQDLKMIEQLVKALA